MVEVYVRFDFSATNDQAEYEATIIEVTFAVEIGEIYIKFRIDSHQVFSQVKVETHAKDLMLQ